WFFLLFYVRLSPASRGERDDGLTAVPHRTSRLAGFAVSRAPAPGARAIAAGRHAILVDLGDDLAVAGEQRLGRAHLRAQGQLALGDAVTAVLLELGRRVVGFRTAVAERALVHLA